MAKTFYTNGTGSQQTLTPSQNEKVAVYDTIADAEADLANLEAGQIVATPDTGDENAQPVDVIQAGNMHAVTSNAVATSNAMPVDSVTVDNLHSVTSNAVARALLLKAGIETGDFSLTFPRSTVQRVSGSYVKIGSIVFANLLVNVTATTAGNDYVNLPSSVPAMNVTKGCFGSWRTESYDGYGNLQNSGTSSIWFIYNNQEYNVGQKAIDGGGSLQLELVYFT